MKQFDSMRRTPWFRGGIAGVMLALFVSVHAMAAFHALHESVCEHAEAADHSCAVTLLASGQIEVPFIAIEASPAEFSLQLQASVPLQIFALADRLDPPGRAPPFALP